MVCPVGLGTLVGLERPGGDVTLNPPMDTLIGSDDRLIVFAEDDSLIKLAEVRCSIVEDAIAPGSDTREPSEPTLVLGWNRRAANVVRLLDQWATPASALRIGASNVTVADLPKTTNLVAEVTPCDPTDRAALDTLAARGGQRVLVLSDDRYSPGHADSRTLVALLNLRDIQKTRGMRFSVISEINEEANRRVAQVTQADDFVVSNQLISLLLAQLSENPYLKRVFDALFSPQGSEIYLKPAPTYLRSNTQANFATVIAAARARGETAIGYRLASQKHQALRRGAEPGQNRSVLNHDEDQVIVLAEEL